MDGLSFYVMFGLGRTEAFRGLCVWDAGRNGGASKCREQKSLNSQTLSFEQSISFASGLAYQTAQNEHKIVIKTRTLSLSWEKADRRGVPCDFSWGSSRRAMTHREYQDG